MSVFLRNLTEDPRFYFAVVISVVVSICVHELAHGIAAVRLGDRTPVERGHMTLSPLVHMGPFAIVVLLLTGLTWGAMPVDDRRLRGRYSPALVALAGPASNLVLAALGIIAVGLWDRFDARGSDAMPGYQSDLRYLLWTFAYANVMLALFNLLPVPPLDGSRVASNLSRGYANLMDRLTTSGAVLVPLILVFVFVSRPLVQFAGEVSLRALQFVRGY